LFRIALLLLLGVPKPATTPAAPSPELALERYRTLITDRGYDIDHQGVVFETLEGERLLSYNVDCPFNPASVVKLATSSAALDRFGPSYRFKTALYTDGGLDSATGALRGNLIIMGAADPSFTTESAFYLARELRARGIHTVSGDLIVKGPLYCNYSTDRQAAGQTIKNALDVEAWTPAVERAFARYCSSTGQSAFESVTIAGNVVLAHDRTTAGLTPLLVYNSPPLVRILKLLNDYSNNWIAHVLGWSLGNAEAVEAHVQSRLGLNDEEVSLRSTSGLGANAMRPRDVITLLRELHGRLRRNRIGPEAVMPVAGLDPGTLEDRYRMPGFTGAVVAKTGTLRGVSTLAGYMYTKDKGVVLFAIMNENGSPHAFRAYQDQLVLEMFALCGGPAPRPYQRPADGSALTERTPGDIPAAPPAPPAEVK
jgi:D-alanyl-D-alanine carboxypeptidase/D-alanyl-D-alanine-endopeptidase (penicillin-binding protein 4)